MKATRPFPRGFTLLEVMIAVLVLSMVTMSIYRFVISTLEAVEASQEMSREEAMVEGFGHFLTRQLQHLPVRLGTLTGEPHQFDNIPSDEMRWIAQPGAGMLTRFAAGEHTVALTTQRQQDGRYELGLRRQDIDSRNESVWYPLLSEVHGLEIRYFDPNVGDWVERWADLAMRPPLVRIRLWLEAESDPQEYVIAIPFVASEALSPNFRRNRQRRGRNNPPPDRGGEEGRPGRPDFRGEEGGGRGRGGEHQGEGPRR